MIKALGYMVVGSDQGEGWSDFATRLLGMQRVDRGGGLQHFRMDDRAQRLIVAPGAAPAIIGWEVADAAALDALATRLDRHGVRVRHGHTAERAVRGLIAFDDPQGNRLEAFHGPERAADPFRPGRPISGFRTGPLGMGHAVLHVTDARALLPFYTEVLGFRITDWGATPYPLYFFHVNPRHHSFAMVGSGRAGLHHFMVELGMLDDVGQGLDIARTKEGLLAYGLGRHTNDHMTSFYAHSPDDFFVEYGWGARQVDPATWVAHETFDGPSLWGHERHHLPEAQRARLRAMAMAAAARGLRAPDPMPGPLLTGCAWADAVIHAE